MILLGYDGENQKHTAAYNGSVIRVDDRHPRVAPVFNGLISVGQKLSIPKGFIPAVTWTHKVEYSDQAWSDLLEIEDK